MKKKRHHFFPKAYLKSFCDDEGKVLVYRKNDPKKRIHQKPDNTGFHKYYYSQPLPEGGVEHNFLESLFSQVETKWPPIVERLRRSEKANGSMMGDIFQFILLQHVRVPANRDAIERLHAEAVKATMRQLDAMGELPPPPQGFEDICRLDRIEVSIDPHRSILAMPRIMREIEENVLKQVGFDVIHNATDTPFLTSDNPVIWLDPSIPEAERRPYGIQLGGPIMLLFPVSSKLMILGESFLRDKSISNGIEHLECTSHEFVNKCNHYICRFAYETVFAQEEGQEALINEHADVSPVLETVELPHEKGRIIVWQRVFGKRKRKPAWRAET